MKSRMVGTTLLVALGVSLLISIRQVPAQPPVSYATIGDHAAEREARVEAALARQVSVEFLETPLRDFVAEVGRLGGINCILRLGKLAEASIPPDSPVTIRLHNVPLEVVLRRVLTELELTFMVQDGVVVITTPEDASSPQNLMPRIYPVRDLVENYTTSDNRQQLDFSPLIDLIDSSIEPDSWQEVGGPSPIEGLENAGALVITQRREIHQKIGNLLTTLRKAKGLQNLSPHSPSTSAVLSGMTTGKLSRSLPLRSRTSASVLPSPPAPARAWQLPQLYSGRQ